VTGRRRLEIIPAIDVMTGKVVRLTKGDPGSAKFYEELGDPVTVAKRWESEGAQTIHVVDLDAALGHGNNAGVIRNIITSTEIALQVGGGIRSFDAARALLAIGTDRIILGSLAFEKQQVVKALLREYGKDRVVVALDHLNGSVVVNGWTTNTQTRLNDAISAFLKLGTELFLVTSVGLDGTMAGPDLETLAKIPVSGADIIAAGGISTIEDIIALKRLGLFGAVVGKSLYEGRLKLVDALRVAKE
jgi:phosphoribosylformimino-5-aminoimidazole carboxamide ribotide isomerase